ncbi:hypothetical protein Acy02nite_69470 [Actinoplanes cyaneus]|uniref:Uncharacterized protein n=1 Tax=Actinoplanes cyaneus TaxID=52696 RepID=A0A919MFC0_9ACTN|nr:hypothetical protein [Actinoplanes cyaneus]MCW2140816.1 hypothetical protein [Actinoplanes cyaneus]GID69066.1 hypothetical protein Acy02nite_69470 [Actinoplanes cyaneus]
MPRSKPSGDGSSYGRPRGSPGASSVKAGQDAASTSVQGGRSQRSRASPGRSRPSPADRRPAEPATPEGRAARAFVDQLAGNPRTVKGKSARELADLFTAAGYTSYPEQTRKAGTSGKAVQVRVFGHPLITNIEVHPGGGRHTPEGSPYWRISLNVNGRIWVVPGDFRGAERLAGQVVRHDE